MKKTAVLMAIAFLFLSATAGFAQTKTDFSGEWTLDVSKSKLDERQRIESGTMKVTQTAQDITVLTDFKRTPRPEGQGGGMGRGGMGGGNQAVTYTLDGKETSSALTGQMTGTSKTQSKWDGDKLMLTSVRTFNTPNGEVTTTLKETWEIVDGGKALKVTRSIESPRGNQSSEFYYAKK